MLQRNVPITNQSIKSRLTAALFVTIITLLTACGPTVRHVSEVIVEGQQAWRTGDIVLRCGYGVESTVVTTRSQSSYSHIGMLYYDTHDSTWMVIHVVPGEDKPEYVKKESVYDYFSSMRAQTGAWLRVECSDSIAAKAAEYVHNKWKEKILFDNQYLLSDSTQLYCTELIWRAYNKQGIDITNGRRHSVPSMFSDDGSCIFPSDIEKSENTLFVKPFKTKTL